jgi:hypothetical protein
MQTILTSTRDIPEPFGPEYPALSAKVQGYRRHGVISRAYGEAVLASIRALQRSAVMTEKPAHANRCASRTSHTRGDKILKAIAARQASSLQACAAKVRRERSPETWRKMYLEAMRAKWEAQADARIAEQRIAA